jgi:hypothetical protein
LGRPGLGTTDAHERVREQARLERYAGEDVGEDFMGVDRTFVDGATEICSPWFDLHEAP